MMAVKVPTLSAAVPYYGGQPTAQEAEQQHRYCCITQV
jgi:carboxymethylenebutenolidase